MYYVRKIKKIEKPKEPEFIEIPKYFLVRTGPGGKIQIPGIKGLVKRGKRYEIPLAMADSFRGAEGYRIIEEVVRIPKK